MPPVNDNWANAIDLGTTSATASWDNTDATMEAGEPSPNNVHSTVWFKCIGQDGYRIRIDAGGSTTTSTNPFDPNNLWTIGVYTGASVSSLTTETFAVGQTSFPQPRTVNLRSGEEFYIQLGSWVFSTYFTTNGVLNFVYEPVPPAPSNDDWSNATVLTGAAGSVSGTTDGSSIDSTDPDLTHWYGASGSVWFKYIPDSSGVLDIDTLGSSYDTLLAVVTGTPGGFALLAGNDDFQDFASNTYVLASHLRLQVEAGVTYYLFLDGYDVGSYVLNWSLTSSLVDGDDFRNPIELDGTSGTYSGNLRSASVQQGESIVLSDNSELLATSLWFSHTVGENGGGIQVTSAGSFDPDLESGIVLSVYEGDSPSGAVIFDDYTYTDGDALIADLDANQTYLIRVAVPSFGIPDAFTLEWSEVVGIPPYFSQGLRYSTELLARLSDLPTPRKYGTAVTIQDYVAFVGGENASGELKNIDLWDIKAGEWVSSFIPDLPEPRSEPVVVSFYPFTGPSWGAQRIPLDTEPSIFVVGGRHNGQAKNQTWVWRWGDTEWSAITPMPTARWGAAGTILNAYFTIGTGVIPGGDALQMPVLSVVGGENESGVIAAHEVMAIAPFYPTESIASDILFTWQTKTSHPQPYAGWRYYQEGPLLTTMVVGGRGSTQTFVYDWNLDSWAPGDFSQDVLHDAEFFGATSWDSGVALDFHYPTLFNNEFSLLFGGATQERYLRLDSLDIGKDELVSRVGAIGSGVSWGATANAPQSARARQLGNNAGFALVGGGEAGGKVLSDFWFVFYDDVAGWMRVPEPCTIDISYMKTTSTDCTVTLFSPIYFRDVVSTEAQTHQDIGPLFPGTPVVLAVNGMIGDFVRGSTSRTAYKSTSSGGSWFLYSSSGPDSFVFDDVRIRVKWKRL